MNTNIKSIYDQYWHERIKESSAEDKNEKGSNEIFKTASSALTEGNRILDVGCSDGSFSHYIKDKFHEIYGVEIVKEAALVAQEQNVLMSVMDLNVSLSYKDNTFDAVSCLDVIEHLLDPGTLIAETYRVLWPDAN